MFGRNQNPNGDMGRCANDWVYLPPGQVGEPKLLLFSFQGVRYVVLFLEWVEQFICTGVSDRGQNAIHIKPKRHEEAVPYAPSTNNSHRIIMLGALNGWQSFKLQILLLVATRHGSNDRNRILSVDGYRQDRQRVPATPSDNFREDLRPLIFRSFWITSWFLICVIKFTRKVFWKKASHRSAVACYRTMMIGYPRRLNCGVVATKWRCVDAGYERRADLEQTWNYDCNKRPRTIKKHPDNDWVPFVVVAECRLPNRFTLKVHTYCTSAGNDRATHQTRVCVLMIIFG